MSEEINDFETIVYDIKVYISNADTKSAYLLECKMRRELTSALFVMKLF